MAYTDSITLTSSALASAAENEIGSINIAQGVSYTFTQIWGGHDNGGGGTMRFICDVLPQANFNYVMNAQTSSFIGNEIPTPVNWSIRGPALVTAYMTPDSAVAGDAKISLQYINSEGATN